MDGGDGRQRQASITVPPLVPAWARDAAVGMVVRHFAPTLLKRLEDDPDELERLQLVAYSRAVFGLSYPFLHRATGMPPEFHNRYYVDEHVVRRARYRVTSQWLTSHRARFLRYLTEGRDVSRTPDATPIIAGFGEERRPFGTGPGRAGDASPIGNAQSALVRSLLSRLAPEPIEDGDWLATLGEFGGRCAYCGAGEPTVSDHVVPLDRTALGEHHRGNLVPSCEPCHAAKGSRGVEVFLADRPERLAAIYVHRRRHGYRPIGDSPAVRAVLDRAAADLAALADRAATELTAALADARKDRSP